MAPPFLILIYRRGMLSQMENRKCKMENDPDEKVYS